MAITDLNAGGAAGGPTYYSVIAASTGRTEQVKQAPGKLHGVHASLLANATVAIYDSSTNSNQIASIVASSLATNPPVDFDFHDMRFQKLTVITTGGVLGLTILYS